MSAAMALHHVQHITIALHTTLHGNFSFYKTVLYQAELVDMGLEMRERSTWNPQFEVRSITVKGSPPRESGCALASEVKYQLELHAERSVTVWCKPCTTLRRCGSKQQVVENKGMKAECIGNCQNGQGTKTWANGNKYQGAWENGKKDGQGTFTWAHGDIYQGQWKNNMPDGQGTYIHADGDIYQGEFKNFKPDGQGTYTWASGGKYQGQWKNGNQDGQGTFTWANGEKYKVWYKEGYMTEMVKK